MKLKYALPSVDTVNDPQWCPNFDVPSLCSVKLSAPLIPQRFDMPSPSFHLTFQLKLGKSSASIPAMFKSTDLITGSTNVMLKSSIQHCLTVSRYFYTMSCASVLQRVQLHPNVPEIGPVVAVLHIRIS